MKRTGSIGVKPGRDEREYGRRLVPLAGNRLVRIRARTGIEGITRFRIEQNGNVAPIGYYEPVLSGIAPASAASVEKKADVAEYPEVFGHVGLLVNEPPDPVGLPFT